MFALPHTFSVPVTARCYDWEGETCTDSKMVTVQHCGQTGEEAVSFVLKNEDIHGDRIAVNVIERTGKLTKVRPLAEYIPFAWGITGKPPMEFLVPSDSLLPD